MKNIASLITDALDLNPLTGTSFEILKRKHAKISGVCPSNIHILEVYRKLVKEKKIKPSETFEEVLKKQKVRTLSGVATISVLTKPFGCPGNCLYCPTEKNMPKSYLSDEPAVMRAILTGFNPYKQIQARIESLYLTGHETNKIELIVMGGSWSHLPRNYQEKYIALCYKAANDFKLKIRNNDYKITDKHSKSYAQEVLKKIKSFELPRTSADLEKEKKRNEKSKHRIVGLTLETRPDLINNEEIKYMRHLGCTRVELGVQSIYNDVLNFNRRGHLIEATVRATKLLKDAGFKINYHMMPNLPGSSIKKDLEMFKVLFSDPRFQPDMIKIYPCVLTRDSELIRLYKNGTYKPYSDRQLIELLLNIKKVIPKYVRIMRLGRDIPAGDIIAGNKMSNIRQELHAIMAKEGWSCKCIRCREIKGIRYLESGITMSRLDYKASDGTEIFLSFEDKKSDKLLAFLRLRIPSKEVNLEILKDSALIREVHSYGQMIAVSQNKKTSAQHKGYGKKLLIEAEKIARKEFGLNKIAVISGVGVRDYYRKNGYRLQDEYMVKKI